MYTVLTGHVSGGLGARLAPAQRNRRRAFRTRAIAAPPALDTRQSERVGYYCTSSETESYRSVMISYQIEFAAFLLLKPWALIPLSANFNTYKPCCKAHS